MSQSYKAQTCLLEKALQWAAILVIGATLASCATYLPPPAVAAQAPLYRIGPGDGLYIFVWENKDISTQVTVRPDGRISFPLASDVLAAGKTPVQLAHDIERRLTRYVKEPMVTVLVNNFVGEYSEQIRVVGEAARPAALPYRRGMTVLDAMIAVGGLTQYAAGNQARLTRTVARGIKETYALELDRLLKDGDVSANVPLEPGDIVIIPQTLF
jgi:polysaccharide export outer membrane protein